MYVTVNGARLYFDVEGAGLVPDGPRMREKPTLLMLHGGPGFDHTMYKPAFSQLTDIAQVIYLDQRGQGRSGGEPETWTLAHWGDDVKGFCDALGIEKPIVYGGSFGGFVAQAYATRHPEHPGKLILVSTAARMDYQAVFAAFERIGGKEARALAEAHLLKPTMETRKAYFEKNLPLYRVKPSDPDARETRDPAPRCRAQIRRAGQRMGADGFPRRPCARALPGADPVRRPRSDRTPRIQRNHCEMPASAPRAARTLRELRPRRIRRRSRARVPGPARIYSRLGPTPRRVLAGP